MLVVRTDSRCPGVRVTTQKPEQVQATGANGATGYAVEAFIDTLLDGYEGSVVPGMAAATVSASTFAFSLPKSATLCPKM